MQPRGAPSSFGGLKEEPLRASWPAMLVDPSWYVKIFCMLHNQKKKRIIYNFLLEFYIYNFSFLSL